MSIDQEEADYAVAKAEYNRVLAKLKIAKAPIVARKKKAIADLRAHWEELARYEAKLWEAGQSLKKEWKE